MTFFADYADSQGRSGNTGSAVMVSEQKHSVISIELVVESLRHEIGDIVRMYHVTHIHTQSWDILQVL